MKIRQGLNSAAAFLALVGIGILLIWAVYEGPEGVCLVCFPIDRQAHTFPFPEEQKKLAQRESSVKLLSQEKEAAITLDLTMQTKSGLETVSLSPAIHREDWVFVPASSVVIWQGKAWIYLERESNRFIRHEILGKISVRERWFLTNGLLPGERIVIRGGPLLLSEELDAQAQIGETGS